MHLSYISSIIFIPTTVMVHAMPLYGQDGSTGRHDLQPSNVQTPIVYAHQDPMNDIATENIQPHRQGRLVSVSPNHHITQTTHVATCHDRSWLETVMMRHAPRGRKQTCQRRWVGAKFSHRYRHIVSKRKHSEASRKGSSSAIWRGRRK